MAKGKLTIHSENILPIIKKSLYSDKDIFVRELVSNSCDAMSKLKILRDQNVVDFKDEELEVRLSIDKENKTLTILDTGIGMTHDEVVSYIAQLAFSGAEEFLKNYESQKESDQIIGHFGLGFYSAFMVSKKVELHTKSYQDTKAVYWSSEGTYDYEIETSDHVNRGTKITLHIDEESEEFLEEVKLKQILQKYCAFLPYPIYLNDQKINDKEPLWLKSPSECTEEEYLQFYRSLYPLEADPIFWIHLNVDYPFHVKGILYFPKITKRFDFSQSHISLFCNRVFVSDNCKDLLPDHLMVLKGAIDSPDIPLNVSRSYLQMDSTVRSLATHIQKKIADRLSQFYQSDKEKFYAAWPDMEMIIKLGIINDEKFYERAKQFLVWKTLQGEWLTIEEYLETNKEKLDGKVFYTTHENDSSSFVKLYLEKNIPVVVASTPLDPPTFNTLERKLTKCKFSRIDSSIDESLLDKDKEQTVLDSEGKTVASKLAGYIKGELGIDQLEVEAKSLASDSLPGFIMMDEDSRRMRDYLAIADRGQMAELPFKRTFVVNTNSPLINAVQKIKDKDPNLAKNIVHQLYELSLLGQKELNHTDLDRFISRSSEVLQTLAVKAAD